MPKSERKWRAPLSQQASTRARVEAAYEKIKSVFPVDDPESATQVDLKVGTVYVERFQAIATRVANQAERWKQKLEQVTSALTDDSEMEDARVLLEEARALYEADDLDAAIAKLGEAEAEIPAVTEGETVSAILS